MWARNTPKSGSSISPAARSPAPPRLPRASDAPVSARVSARPLTKFSESGEPEPEHDQHAEQAYRDHRQDFPRLAARIGEAQFQRGETAHLAPLAAGKREVCGAQSGVKVLLGLDHSEDGRATTVAACR